METPPAGVGSSLRGNGTESGVNEIDRRIAHRLASLRTAQGWTLEMLAQRTGISRATLSGVERCEVSPTASMLSTLCGQYGWTLSRLMVETEHALHSVVRATEQLIWRDPETGYERRVLSPPHLNLKAELAEVSLPAGASISYGAAYLPGLEHHLWMLDGSLSLEHGDTTFKLEKRDCIRYVLSGPSRFFCGRRSARYVIALVHP